MMNFRSAKWSTWNILVLDAVKAKLSTLGFPEEDILPILDVVAFPDISGIKTVTVRSFRVISS